MHLRRIDDDLWIAGARIEVAGIRLPLNMTVLRLPNGRLWLHSPHVPGTGQEAWRAELEALGPVGYLIAPNRFHHLSLPQAKALFPDAEVHGAPGLKEKHKHLRFDGVLRDEPPAAWADTIEQHLLQGMPRLQEVVCFHRPSATLIVTDLLFHLSPSDHWWTWFYQRLAGVHTGVRQSRMVMLMVRDRVALRDSLERVLAWPFQRILVAHGEPVEINARSALEQLVP